MPGNLACGQWRKNVPEPHLSGSAVFLVMFTGRGVVKTASMALQDDCGQVYVVPEGPDAVLVLAQLPVSVVLHPAGKCHQVGSSS